MTSFEIVCPACAARFECPAERAGRGVRCGACAQVFVAPAPPVAAPPVVLAAPLVVAKPLPVAVALPPRAAPVRVAEVVREPRRRSRSRHDGVDTEPAKTSPLVYVLGGVGGLAVLGVLLLAGYWLKPSGRGPEVAAVAPFAGAPSPAVEPQPPREDTPAPAVAVPVPPAASKDIPPPPPPAASAAEAIARVKDSTAYIRTHASGSLSMGSGFFAGPSGYVVTNAHVIGCGPKKLERPTRVEVVVHSGEATSGSTRPASWG